MREIDEIIIHATATNPSWMANNSVDDVVAEIRRWHVEERKWSDIQAYLRDYADTLQARFD